MARNSATNNFKSTVLMKSGHRCPVPSHTHALAILPRPLLSFPYFLSFSFRIASPNPPPNNQQLLPSLDFLHLLSLPSPSVSSALFAHYHTALHDGLETDPQLQHDSFVLLSVPVGPEPPRPGSFALSVTPHTLIIQKPFRMKGAQ